MNFSLCFVDQPKRLLKLSKKRINFFSKPEDISIYHFNELKTNMYHVVYHINDEYMVGTKRVGQQAQFPYRQFINCFFFLDSNFFLLEETLGAYQDEIIGHIKSNTSVNINKSQISNSDFKNVCVSLTGFIKKLEYIDENEDDHYLDSVSWTEFETITEKFTIDRITLSVEDQFVSIYSKGTISVDNSDEAYLIKFTRDIINAISNNY